MKKIVNNKKFKIIFTSAIIVLLIILYYVFRTNEDVVTRVSRVLWAKYYNIECVDINCKYVAAYKGDKKGESTVKIIDSNGKTVIKYKINAKDELTKKIVTSTNKYAILALKDDNDYTHGYSVVNTKGKEVLNKDDETPIVITDKLFCTKNNELYTIYNYKGDIVFKDVKDLKFYDNNRIITFINNELTIVNEDGNIILNGYNIVEEVKENDDVLYLIVSDKDKSYYYFDIKNNKIKGESFSSYVKYSNNKLVITKKNNNETKRFLLKTNGETLKELDSSKTIHEITKNIDTDKYAVLEDSLVNKNQKGLLVENKEDHSFGIYDLSSNNYDKLFDFKENLDSSYGEKVVIYSLYQDDKDVFLEVGCSTTYCNEENIIVYNPYTNKISFKTSNNLKEIKKYREYTGGYKVITYKDKTYSLIDKEGNILLDSSNNIIVIDQDIIIDDDSSNSNVILYLSKENKIINNEETLALLDDSSNYVVYKYYDDKNLYIYNKTGLLKEIPISQSSINMGDKYFSYLGKNKINIYSFIDDKTISIDLNNGEKLSDEEGKTIEPNKGVVVISNPNDKTIRVLNYNKKTIKTIKKSIVKSVNFDKKNNSIFLITKKGKKYILYIIK